MHGRQVFKDHCCCHSNCLGGSPDTTVCIPSLLSGKRLFLPRAPGLSPFSVVSGFFINLLTDNSVYCIKHGEHVMILHLFFFSTQTWRQFMLYCLNIYIYIHIYNYYYRVCVYIYICILFILSLATFMQRIKNSLNSILNCLLMFPIQIWDTSWYA